MAKIVIIGGGVSGLSAGIYSQLLGHRAIILERAHEVGGNLTGWDRSGHHIDNCIHWLTGTNAKTKTYETWLELGALSPTVGIVRNDTLYTYERDGVRLSLCRSLEELKESLISLSPDDESEVERFIGAIRAACLLSGISEEGERSGIRDKATALARLARYSPLSVGGLAKRFKSRYIREFLECFITPYFSAIALIFVFAHFTSSNADLPEGGSRSMATRMKERFLSLGGEIRCKSEVTKINTEGELVTSVTLRDGEVIEADYAVLTCDPAEAYGKMIGEKMPMALRRLYRNSSLKRFSSFQAAFAYDGEKLPFVGDFCFPLRRKDRLILGCDYLTVREFSHEKGFSPSGKSTIQAMIFLDEDTSVRIIGEREELPEVYKKKKARYAEAIKQALEFKWPSFKGRLTLLDAWTPATYRRYTGSEMGSYMSFAFGGGFLPTTARVKHRYAKNLLLATQWQTPPGGLPIAAMRGKEAAKKIAELERTRVSRSRRLSTGTASFR